MGVSLPRRPDLLVAVVALDLAGFGMVVSDIQFRLEAMGLKGWAIGAVLSSMFVVQIPASAFWGRVADRVGPRRVLVGCTLLSALSMAMYGFAHSPWAVLGSRVLAGAGAANVAMAYSIASVAATPERRPRLVGWLGASTVLGLTAGAAVGGLVAQPYGQSALGLIAMGYSLLAAAVGWASAPETERKPDEETKRRVFDLYRGPLLTLMVVAAAGWLSLATLEGTFGRLIRATLGFGQREFGLVFGLESLVGFVAQGFLFERLARRFPPYALLAVGFGLTGLGLALMPFAPSFLPLALAGAVFALGGGLNTPAVNEMIAERTSEARRSEAYGAVQSLRSVGFVVAPTAGGALFDVHPWLPYLLAAGICGGVAFLAARVLRAPSEAQASGTLSR